jgi:antitoxin FitA
MVALQIRDVPDDVRDRLAELARSRGQSLQVYLLALVTRDADRADNLALLSRFTDRTDGSRAEPSTGRADVAEEIRRMREERTDHLMRVINGETS